jgi:hypothetical protein
MLLQDVDLRYTLGVQDSLGPYRSVLWLAVYDVDTGISTESQLAAAICSFVS